MDPRLLDGTVEIFAPQRGNFPMRDLIRQRPVEISGNHTIQRDEVGALLYVTTAGTITVGAGLTIGEGVLIVNTTTSQVTLSGSGYTLNGQSSVTLAAGSAGVYSSVYIARLTAGDAAVIGELA